MLIAKVHKYPSTSLYLCCIYFVTCSQLYEDCMVRNPANEHFKETQLFSPVHTNYYDNCQLYFKGHGDQISLVEPVFLVRNGAKQS